MRISYVKTARHLPPDIKEIHYANRGRLFSEVAAILAARIASGAQVEQALAMRSKLLQSSVTQWRLASTQIALDLHVASLAGLGNAMHAWRAKWQHLLCSGVLVLGGWVAASPAGAQGSAQAEAPAFAHPPELQQWVLETGDNDGAPFIVIDKRQARLWLFSAAGMPLGDTPVLLGLAHGDASVPGIGEMAMRDIKPHERTTPAGRFIAEAGRNANGEDIFWIDYDAAVSMHRVRATNPAERRLQRLATPSPTDNRISYGCINVPAQFYNQRIVPTFSSQRGVVYVLPETGSAPSLFSVTQTNTGRAVTSVVDTSSVLEH